MLIIQYTVTVQLYSYIIHNRHRLLILILIYYRTICVLVYIVYRSTVYVVYIIYTVLVYSTGSNSIIQYLYIL